MSSTKYNFVENRICICVKARIMSHVTNGNFDIHMYNKSDSTYVKAYQLNICFQGIVYFIYDGEFCHSNRVQTIFWTLQDLEFLCLSPKLRLFYIGAKITRFTKIRNFFFFSTNITILDIEVFFSDISHEMAFGKEKK